MYLVIFYNQINGIHFRMKCTFNKYFNLKRYLVICYEMNINLIVRRKLKRISCLVENGMFKIKKKVLWVRNIHKCEPFPHQQGGC